MAFNGMLACLRLRRGETFTERVYGLALVESWKACLRQSVDDDMGAWWSAFSGEISGPGCGCPVLT